MNSTDIQSEESINTTENFSSISEPRKQILIVESDKDGARRLASQLTSSGYETITHDPANAVAAATKNPPDLVIVDITILGDLGFVFAERIQRSVRWCVPTIFVTTGNEPRLRKKAEVFQAAGFFEGQYDPKKLVSAIDSAFREEEIDETVETLNE